MNKADNQTKTTLDVFYLILKIWKNLRKIRKIQIISLFFLMLLSGLSEAFSIAAIVPYLSILTNSEKLNEFRIVKTYSNLLGIENNSQLLLSITILFCTTIIFAAIIRVLNIRFNGLVCAWIASDISSQSYTNTLYQKYSFHIQTNTSKVVTTLGNFTNATSVFLNLILLFITNLFISTCILCSILILNFKLALIIGSTICSAYLIISAFSSKLLFNNSLLISRTSQEQVKTIQEGLGAIRDIIIDNTHNRYISRFNQVDEIMRLRLADNNFIGSAPRYAVEAIAIIVISLIGYSYTSSESGVSEIIPILGTFALGAQKLLPSLQQAFFSLSGMKSRVSLVDLVIESLENKTKKSDKFTGIKKFEFTNSIEFKNVSYQYPKREKKAIENFTLKINKGSRIGIVGTTGSGKSTFIDLILGLIEPAEGEIYIDNENIHEQSNNALMTSWRSSISHVPQNIYLTDSSIADNIAFIDHKENIDYLRLKNAARMANIDQFIQSLPAKYETYIGERGIQLSGGQKQRIGIARALYKRSKVLLFDEATSALDKNTETSVIKSINDLSKNLTLIIVAHRLSTVEKCDQIIKIENGKIVEKGTPDEMGLYK